MTLSTILPRGHRRPPAERGRRGFTAADPLGALAILSVVAVVALWVMNQGGPLGLTTADRAMGSLGLLTGLLASDLMILQVVLLARIPWVERSWGHDLLTRRHRWIGFASFWLMIGHVVLFAVERAVREPDAMLDALVRVFVTDSWMLFATVGTVLLIMVVVTSIRAARRRLRYESWHLLHLYSYAGIAATFPTRSSTAPTSTRPGPASTGGACTASRSPSPSCSASPCLPGAPSTTDCASSRSSPRHPAPCPSRSQGTAWTG